MINFLKERRKKLSDWLNVTRPLDNIHPGGEEFIRVLKYTELKMGIISI